jgi:hypothetical protein
MSSALRLTVPSDIAEELISEGDAVPSVMTRSVGDVVQLVVSAVEFGDSAITVAMAAVALPGLIRKVVDRSRRRGGDGVPKVILRVGDREVTLELHPDVPIDELGAQLAESVHSLSPSSTSG